MMFRPLIAAAVLALGLAAPAVAGEIRPSPKVVLELFTSQGCSSCPPADALLEELSQKPDVVGLAYHVDYWDYIGWPDTFGNKAHSDHQRAYASAWGSSRIFTPQLVVNGREGVVGSRRNEIAPAVDKEALALPVNLAVKGEMLKISIPPSAGREDAVIWLVSYIDRAEVVIERGENAGKTVAYTQIVTGRQALGMWEAATGAQLTLPLSEVLASPANGAAILVQEERDGLPGKILGAASYQR
jgi:hypothetical protein